MCKKTANQACVYCLRIRWAEKYFGDAQINFFLRFWSEEQKKNFFSSQITPNRYGRFASFRSTILAQEGTFIAWRGATESYVRISVPAHNAGVKTKKKKKRLRCEILGLVLAFTCVFRPGTRLYSRLGGARAEIWGGRTRNAPRDAGLCCPRYRIRNCYVSFASSQTSVLKISIYFSIKLG